MFKKKTKKLSPLPTAPTLAEIIEDLDSFHVEKRQPAKVRNLDESNMSDTEWWNAFETFFQDVEDFKRLRTDINGYKLKLESAKLEIDTTAKNLRNDLEENLNKAKAEIVD